MSKADKMFEELGYKLVGEDEHYIRYTENINDKMSLIWFELKPKRMYRAYQFENIKIHLAIHEKMKELGWLDE